MGGIGAAAQVEEGVQGVGRTQIGMLAKVGGQKPAAVCPDLRPHIRARVEVAVKHHRADAGGEQVGVGGAEEGAVGDPVVVQLPVADGAAQQVQITGGVGSRDVSQQAPATPLAVAVEGPVAPDPGAHLRATDRERAADQHPAEEITFGLRRGKALNPGALHPPRAGPS